jgi:hypothetical protein
MKRVLIPILVGVVLSVFFFALAVVSDGACHCVKPTIILFPCVGLAEGLGWEFISLPLMALQFPIYSVVIAKVRGGGWRILVFLILLVIHAVAAVVGLRVYPH